MRSGLSIASALLVTAANAEPFTTPAPVGQAYVYAVSSAGGSGNEEYTITPPPTGYYMMSFKVNFTEAGTKSAPVTLTCNFNNNGKNFFYK